jgi:hypothetical protein
VGVYGLWGTDTVLFARLLPPFDSFAVSKEVLPDGTWQSTSWFLSAGNLPSPIGTTHRAFNERFPYANPVFPDTP